MRYTYSFFIILFTTLFLVSVTHADSNYEDEETGKPKEKLFHINPSIDLKPTVKTQYGRDYIVAKSVFPLLQSDNENIDNEEIDNMTAAMSIDDFNEQIASLIKEEVSEFKSNVSAIKTSKDLPKKELKNNLRIDFNTAVLNKNANPLISIRFSIQRQFAGNKGLSLKHHSFNYDLNNGRALALADLFLPESDYLGLLSDYSRDYLSKRLKNRNKIIDGTAPVADHFKVWNLQSTGLLITFEPEQVAEKRVGTQTVLIPYAVLNDIVAPDSPLGQCLKHKRRCLREPVLTGGFMSAIEGGVSTFA